MRKHSQRLLNFPAIFLIFALVIAAFTINGSPASAVAQTEIDYAVTQTSSSIADLSTSAQVAPSSGDFTVEGWFKSTGSMTSSVEYPLWNLGGRILAAKNNTFWIQRNKSGGSADWVDTGKQVPLTQWFHVAVTHTNSTKLVTLAVNGTTIWSEAQATAWESSSAPGFNIGNSSTGSSTFWQGQFDQIRVWSNSLSDSALAIAMHTYATSAVSGATALAFYDFNDIDVATSVADITSNNFALTVGTGTNRAFNREDVKSIDSTTIPGKIIYGFTRTYLTSNGGFFAPAFNSTSYSYVAVAGGGGGGSNRGGGGGAGGYADSSTGNLTLSKSSTYQIKVGQGGTGAWGYLADGRQARNGQDTSITQVGGSALKTLAGGGAGGSHAGGGDPTQENGATGGSGGGASMCYGSTNPAGGAATSGQGYAGATLVGESTYCAYRIFGDLRQTGGGGGASAAGKIGQQDVKDPTSSTVGQRPDGGAGVSTTIAGGTKVLAGGGGGAVALEPAEYNKGSDPQYWSSFYGSGGSGVGGNGADVPVYAPTSDIAGLAGGNATVNTGSGGGGGGASSGSFAMPLGGNGSAGVVYLVATPDAYLSVVSNTGTGAAVNEPFANAPQITLTGGSSTTVTCSVSAGASISGCSETGSGTLTFDELKFTSGTVGTTYTLTFSAPGYAPTTLGVTLLALPANLTVSNTGATSASSITWVNGTVFANSANLDVTVVGVTTVKNELNARPVALKTTGLLTISNDIIATSGTNSILLKGSKINVASGNITTLGGSATLWSTIGLSGVTTNSNEVIGIEISRSITTNGGNIIVGGGTDPTTQSVKANVGVKINSKGGLIANKTGGNGGNISIRADSVANNNSGAQSYAQVGLYLLTDQSGDAKITSNGSGNVDIVSVGSAWTNGVGKASAAMVLRTTGSTANSAASTAEISAENGNINISATSTNTPVNYGLALIPEGWSAYAAPKIFATGTGSVNITAQAGQAASGNTYQSGNIGLWLGQVNRGYYSKGLIYTNSGTLNINASAGATNDVLSSYGIYMKGKIESIGSGAVNVTAQAGNTVSADSIGIFMDNTLDLSVGSFTPVPELYAKDGLLTIDARGGNITSATNTVTSCGARLWTNFGISTGGIGSVVFAHAFGGDITGTSGTFTSNGLELRRLVIPTGSLTFSDLQGGDITGTSATSSSNGLFVDQLSSISTTNSTLTITSAVGGNLTTTTGTATSRGIYLVGSNLSSSGNKSITASSGTVTATGSGEVKSYGLQLATASIKSTADGNGSLTINASAGNLRTAGGSSQSYGIYTSTSGVASEISTNTGNISINATGGAITDSSSTSIESSYGLGLDTSSLLKSTSGQISVTATTGNLSGNGGNKTTGGLFLGTSAQISTLNDITLQASTGSITGGAASSNQTYGIKNSGGSISVNSTGTGAISITATGGNISAPVTTTSYTNKSYGLWAVLTPTVPTFSTDTGVLGVTATAGNITSGTSDSRDTSIGIYVETGTFTTSTGQIQLAGNAGQAVTTSEISTNFSRGIYLVSTSVSATAAGGSISLVGNGAPTTNQAVYNSMGIGFFGGSLSAKTSISTTTGNITIAGNSGSTAGLNQIGYSQSDYSFVSSTSGNISITGTAEANSRSTTNGACTGAFIGSLANAANISGITSTSGNISVVGKGCDKTAASTGFTSRGIYLMAAQIQTTTTTAGSGNISIKADSGNSGSGNNTNVFGLYQMSVQGSTSYSATVTTAAGNIEIKAGLATQSSTKGTGDWTAIFGKLTTNSAAGLVGTFKSTSGGNVTITADATATTDGTANTNASGTGMDLGTGNSSNLPTEIDATNGVVTINATAASAGYGIFISGLYDYLTKVQIGASASSTVINAVASGSSYTNAGYRVNGPYTLGGTSATGNITINTNTIYDYNSGAGAAPTYLDTTGTFTVQPIASNFGNAFNTPGISSTDLILNFKPTTRLTGFTVGKSGATKNLKINNDVRLNSSDSTLTLYGGSLTATTRIEAVKLGADVTNSVSLSNTSNTFSKIGLTSSQSTKSIAIANSASSWTAEDVSGIVAVYGIPAKLRILSQPTTGTSNNALGTFSIGFKDAYDIAIGTSNTLYSQSVAVTASIASGNSSTLGGTVSPASSAAPVAFSDLTLDSPGNHTITFAATGFTSATSSTISISAGPDTSASFSYSSGTNTVAYGASAQLPTWTNITTTGSKTYSTTTATSICTLNTSTGAITVVAPGNCVVTAVIATDGTYAATTKTQTLVITKANQSSISISSTSVTYGQTLTLSASGGTGGGTISYALDATQTNTCTLASGVITPGNAGSVCYVIATRAGGTNYNDVSSTSTSITINKASQTTSVTVPSGVTIQYLQSPGLDLTALTYGGGNGTGSYEFSTLSSNCTITSGVLTSTLARSSSCTITVKRSSDTNYNISSGTNMTVTVTYADQTPVTVTSANSGTWGTDISLSKSGGSGTGLATWLRVSGSNCSVNGTTLSSTGAGTCVIKVSIAGDTNYNAASSSDFTVTFNKQSQSPISWSGTVPTSVDYLGTATLAITGGSGTGSVIYEPSNTSTCRVAANILTVGDAGSTCAIVVTKLADSDYFATDLTARSFTVNKINQANTLAFSNANSMVYGETLTLLATGGSGDGAITYSVTSAGTTGCSIASTTLSVTASGNCAISASRAASANYNATSTPATMTLAVSKASQSLQFTSTVPSSPIAGSSYTVGATATSGLAPTYSIVSGNCSIAAAVISFTGSGNCVIQAAQSGDGQYLAATSIRQTVAVGSRNQTLTFTAATNAIPAKTYSDSAFVVEATSTESDAVVTYSLGSGTTNNACAVTTYGLVTIRSVGVCEIKADSAATLAYVAASSIIKTIQVNADFANAPYVISSSAGNKAVTLSFTQPTYNGGAVITGYQLVAIDQTTGATFIESGCSASLTNDLASCTVRGLNNGVTYKVQVAAINAAGVGEYSVFSAPLTAATNPAAVQGLQVAEDNTSLVITWTDPDSLGGGTFDSYRIFIKRSQDTLYNANYFVVNSQSTHSYTASTQWPSGTALANGVSYDVKVVTVTTANSSELSSNTAVVNKVPRTVPDAPILASAITIDSNLVISWAVPVSDGGAAINAYSAVFDGSNCALASATDTFCVVPEPTTPGDYQYEVRAQNVAGVGPAASSLFSVPGATSAPATTQVAPATTSGGKVKKPSAAKPNTAVTPTPTATPSATETPTPTPTANAADVVSTSQLEIWRVVVIFVAMITFMFLFILLKKKNEKRENKHTR